ncbi:MAG: ATP-dependent Clp protease adaptor ClpS [Dehalococcoidia bacterium]
MATVTKPGAEVLDEIDQQVDKPYHLILLDDDHHTYAYVIRMVRQLFGYSKEKAFAIACVVDSQGKAIVMTGSRAEAERKQTEIHSFGADPDMPDSVGSMSATLEPAA